MAISYPRDLLEFNGVLPHRTLSFRPFYSQTRRLSRGAQAQVAGLAADLWTADITTHLLTWRQAAEFEAWLQSVDGGARLFKLWHTLHRYPAEYPNGFAGMNRAGGGAFDGTCNLASIGGSRDTIGLSTLPANFKFTVGDMVSFALGASSRSLHRVLESVDANGSGVVTLSIRPTVVLGAATDVSATLVKPWCLASVHADSIRPVYEADNQHATISFSATQSY